MTRTKKQQLKEVDLEMELYGSTSALAHKRKRLHEQIYKPTLRQRMFGFRRGRLTKAESNELKQSEIVENIKQLLEEEEFDVQKRQSC